MFGLKDLFEKYKGWVSLAFLLFIAWKLKGLFSGILSVGDAIGSAAAGATAGVADAGKKAQQKVAIKTVKSDATDADVTVFESDAAALAGFLGRLPGSWSNWIYPDRVRALGVAKKYSRQMMSGSTGLVHLGKPVLRKASLQLAVLAPFYKDATAGRSLTADLDGAMSLYPDNVKAIYYAFVK